MSRTSALWSAAALTVIFVLLLGAVVLHPVLTANAGDAGNTSPITVVSDQWDDDDEDERYEDDDHDDEYEDEDDDDDDHEDEDDDVDDDD